MALARRRKCPEGSWREDRIINSIMSNYTKRLPDAEESVFVHVELHVQDMGSLNEISADFEIDIFFTQIWQDLRSASPTTASASGILLWSLDTSAIYGLQTHA
uniref:Neurotransmitter-gated ion-channel ligand-binding domain-containing protein n=1 Tax=Ditylenchus dipsaci TaxID=166011 RepID=A0A915CKY1_9BILA